MVSMILTECYVLLVWDGTITVIYRGLHGMLFFNVAVFTIESLIACLFFREIMVISLCIEDRYNGLRAETQWLSTTTEGSISISCSYYPSGGGYVCPTSVKLVLLHCHSFGILS